jgi:hypothetical protein
LEHNICRNLTTDNFAKKAIVHSAVP